VDEDSVVNHGCRGDPCVGDRQTPGRRRRGEPEGRRSRCWMGTCYRSDLGGKTTSGPMATIICGR
jgi:hypothetical protein